MTVYASPTSEGVATVACLAPPADAAAFKARVRGDRRHAQARVRQAVPGRPRSGATPSARHDFAGSTARSPTAARDRARDNATFKEQAGGRAQDPGRVRRRRPSSSRQTATSPADALINAAIAERLAAAGSAWKRAAAAAASKDKGGFARASGRDQAAQQDRATLAERTGSAG